MIKKAQYYHANIFAMKAQIFLRLNPNQAGGGQICPPVEKTLNISGTKSRIDLKPGCKFKFVVCLETYLKKLVRSDH